MHPVMSPRIRLLSCRPLWKLGVQAECALMRHVVQEDAMRIVATCSLGTHASVPAFIEACEAQQRDLYRCTRA